MKPVLNLIQKLLNLTNDKAATTAEAEAALNKAKELLEANDLTMSDLDVLQAKEAVLERSVIFKKSEVYHEFVVHLADAVAQLYDCRAIALSGKSEFGFIGMREDIQMAVITFDFLFNSWQAIAKNDIPDFLVGQYERKKFYKGHGQGFTAAISQRIAKLIHERKQTAVNTSCALVVIETKQEKLQEALSKMQQMKTPKIYGEGYVEGYIRGENQVLGGAICK